MSTKCHSSNRGPQGLPANYKVVIRQPCKGNVSAPSSTGPRRRTGSDVGAELLVGVVLGVLGVHVVLVVVVLEVLDALVDAPSNPSTPFSRTSTRSHILRTEPAAWLT